mmetsp:Transcript_23720/g.24180  ORF Transcript_23720/g.24180 Transcript_23720/m.24180 type:complete len:168 (-) Transcript_23720:1227-1730(-)
MVDNDNDATPENIPNPSENQGDIFEDWGHDGIYPRRQKGGEYNKAELKNFPPNMIPFVLQMFEHFFPKVFVEEVMLHSINKEMIETNQAKVSYGEFLRFVRLWFFMSTTHFDNRRDFWSLKTIETFLGAPYRLNDYMSWTRFETILNFLYFTDMEPPSYKDNFWEVQ